MKELFKLKVETLRTEAISELASSILKLNFATRNGERWKMYDLQSLKLSVQMFSGKKYKISYYIDYNNGTKSFYSSSIGHLLIKNITTDSLCELTDILLNHPSNN